MTRPARMIRIATVRATGARYIVQRLTIPGTGPAAVHCWGEVVAYKGASSSHSASRTFVATDVDVAEAPATPALMAELFRQAVRAAEGAGAHVIKQGKRYTTLSHIPAI